MKNFSEATAIKPSLRLDLKLLLTPIGSVPCQVIINELTHFNNTINNITTINCQFSLNETINISIKIQRQHPDAVQIVLQIDGHEVLPKYQHLASPPTDYLDFNDVWTLQIPNFYTWYHQITGQGWIA